MVFDKVGRRTGSPVGICPCLCRLNQPRDTVFAKEVYAPPMRPSGTRNGHNGHNWGALTCDLSMSRVIPVRYSRLLLATRAIGDGKKNVFYFGRPSGIYTSVVLKIFQDPRDTFWKALLIQNFADQRSRHHLPPRPGSRSKWMSSSISFHCDCSKV